MGEDAVLIDASVILHALGAPALAYGIETIASSDPAFDGIPGLRRVDPLRG
ncbi:hypothetical protein [Microbacterium sp.]|uniref:hypothetical protein n=1 Tax=Microbacterium sp. TaxID=51671 RepID=UPI0039E4D973